MKTLPFDKYDLYRRSVQSPENDVIFLRDTYRRHRGRNPCVFREDFCGTALMSVEWVKMGPRYEASGVDLDPEPLAYGREHYVPLLSGNQKGRLHLYERDVLARNLPMADMSVALNFSYFLFKTRARLREYFKNVHRHLSPGGIALFDCFGGQQCQDEIEDRTAHRGFSYYWDQTGFDPISNEAVFHIHFRWRGKKYEKVFTYDWRMWTIPELREILAEAGFTKTSVYWEGTTRKGTGNGVFSLATVGEPCLSWIAYIVAEK